jgi:hypothetical protein
MGVGVDLKVLFIHVEPEIRARWAPSTSSIERRAEQQSESGGFLVGITF